MYSQNDFHIAKMVTDEGKDLSIKGNFPLQTIIPGTWVSFAGEWSDHPKYGRQLTVTRSPVNAGKWTDAKVESVLSSNGVGPQLRLQVKVLAKSKDLEVADLLNSGDLTGLGSDLVTQQFVLSRWNSIRVLFEASHFLSEAGVPTKVAGKVWSVLGEKLEESITSDPWILVRVAGITFKEADEVAVRLGIPLTNEGRLNGAILTAIREVASEGHVYATTGQVVSAVGQMIQGSQIPTADIANSIKRLKDQNQISVERGYGGVTALYEPWIEHMELYCSESLHSRSHTASKGDSSCSKEEAREELSKWAIGRKVILTETQINAATNCVTEPVSILTGLPGTGKTTTLQAVVSVLKDKSVPFLLVAPTGIAAKRLSSVTGANASTVHRAFSAQGFNTDEDRESAYEGVVGESASGRSSSTQGEDWGYGPNNPHPAQVVVIDESSMLDLHMLYRQ
jgi:exodeoxyribonuclease V alpha subunit